MNRIRCFCSTELFNSVEALIRHIRMHHENISSISCCFYNCNRRYDRLDSYQWHLQTHCRSTIVNDSSDSMVQITSEQAIPCISTAENYTQSNTISESENIDIHIDSASNIKIDLLKQIVKAYCNESVPRNKSLSIIKSVANGFLKYLNILRNKLIDTFVDPGIIRFLDELVDNSIIKSEYKLLSELRKTDFFVEANFLSIHREIQEVLTSGGQIALKSIDYSIAMLPLYTFFSLLFNKTKFLAEVVSYISDLKLRDQNVIYNFIQSTLWHELNQNDDLSILCIPMFVYFDEFEPDNALGSHAGFQKLGGVYVKFPCIPEYLQSKLSHIFVGMLLFSEDRKKFGNELVFESFINELNSLQELGIDIHDEISFDGNRIKKVKIIPSLILGDNLGLNTILGFSETFSSNFYCRLCKQHREINKIDVYENISMLRNPQNYNSDVEVNDFKITGIKENSIWNNLKQFHVTRNYSVDVMHDLLEGVCHYDLKFILNRFIKHYEFFTLDQLNYRLLTFNYGPIYCSNKPPILSLDFHKKLKLQLSSSEMLVFVKCLGLMIGDLVVDCEEWTLYLLLRQIVFISCESDSFQTGVPEHFRQLVCDHNALYMKISESTLQPKFHNLIHYSNIMNKIGPLKHISSMRFESVHKKLKKICNSSNNKINLLKTIYTKYQIILFDFLINYSDILEDKIKIGNVSELPGETFSKYDIISEIPLRTISYLQFKQTLFKPGMVVHIGEYDDNIPLFGLIVHICSINDIFLLCIQRLLTHGFDAHYHAFRIEYENEFLSVNVLSLESSYTAYICTSKEDSYFLN
ncbi:uncharacterized protein LOC131805637 [Musca domestica]|uniref:Uncharacterized protein LOC131805637 n=1 Tax=Musca domestica TaxID=7370 RepID=A0ABM3VGW5_MUSDO|nr:uncharacterized protein LOC131805637 [Musca domestica]